MLSATAALAQFEQFDPCEGGLSPVVSAKVINALPFPSEILSPNSLRHYSILSRNGRDAVAIMDASASTNANGQHLTYWLHESGDGHQYTIVYGTNPVFSFNVRTGHNENAGPYLAVIDECGRSDWTGYGVAALTPQDALWWLRDDLFEMEEPHLVSSFPGFKHRTKLYDTLYVAAMRLGEGKKSKALHSIRRFQSLIRIQRHRLGKEVTRAYVDYTKMVISAIKHPEP